MSVIRPIHTEADYEATLAGIETLFAARRGTPEGDRLEVLVALVEQYENDHYSMPLPIPLKR